MKHYLATIAFWIITLRLFGQLTPEFRALSVNNDGSLRGPTNFLDANFIVRTGPDAKLSRPIVPNTSQARSWASDTTELYHLGDSFTYGAGTAQYTNNYVSKLAGLLGIPGINLANGSFSIADTSWAAFSGWAVTNNGFAFRAPTNITEEQNWTVLVGFNDLRTSGTSASMFRKGLDHLIHFLAIPNTAKRYAQTPDSTSGTWSPIPWSNGMGLMGASSSSGTINFSNIVGSDVYVGYLAWATNFGGTISIAIDGTTVTNFSTASAAYGNREYINGSDPNIPDHAGPYGNGKIDFCPQLFKASDIGFAAHSVSITASGGPCYVLWVSGNGFPRTARKGPNVFLGTIPRQSPWTTPATDALHASFNAQISGAITAAKASNLRVALAPTASWYQPATMQSVDGVHPNDSGHAAIASSFEVPFTPDIPSIVSGQTTAPQTGIGPGAFSTLSVSSTSDFVGNLTIHDRLLVLPTGTTVAGGKSSRFGYGSVAGSSINIIGGDSALDRQLTIVGNGMSVKVNSTGVDANLSLGVVGTTVQIQGAATVAQTLNVTGLATFSDRIIVVPAAISGGHLHRIGQDATSASAITLQTGDTALDRHLTINGNSISVKVNSTGVAANLSLGTSGNNVAVLGSASVAQTLTVTGQSAFNDGATLSKTLASTSGTDRAMHMTYTVNQASGTGSSAGLEIAATTTALGSGTHRLLNMSDDGTPRAYFQTDGRLVIISPNGTSPIIFRGDNATDSQVHITYAQGLDRRATIAGNSFKVTTADGLTPQNAVINDAGTTVTIGGSLQVTTEIVLGSGQTVSWGSGVPAITRSNGSTYHRTDGTGPNFYVRENNAWVAK